MTKFQIGDRVSWSSYEATIMSVSNTTGYCTLFIHDENFYGHNGEHLRGIVCGYTEQEYFGHCWNVDIDHIRLIEPLCNSEGILYD